ncbi:MAG: AAA family ATPase, partial [Chloroflexota bacterium]|nr:AAA family ATPase [Chloroflexota bacterium]
MDLFESNRRQTLERAAPLSARMRPRSLDEIVGHTEILGPGSLLRQAIDADQLFSLVLWGPPGAGKTTLARLVAAQSKAEFVAISAVSSGVADLRAIVKDAA